MGNELIDRRVAIDDFQMFRKYDSNSTHNDWVDRIETILKAQPTIDAVEVVRCKDCVHYKGHWYCETWNNSPGFPAVKEDGFCNMAERMTDGTD